MKQREMDKVTEYARKFKEDQNILKVLTKESISVIYAGKKPTQNVPLAIVIFESQKKKRLSVLIIKLTILKLKQRQGESTLDLRYVML